MGRSIPTTKELLEKFILIEEKHNLEHENLKETLDLVVNKLVGLDKHNDITEAQVTFFLPNSLGLSPPAKHTQHLSLIHI